MGGGGGDSFTVNDLPNINLTADQLLRDYANANNYLSPIMADAGRKLEKNLADAESKNTPYTQDSLAAINQMRKLSGLGPWADKYKNAAEKTAKLSKELADNEGKYKALISGKVQKYEPFDVPKGREKEYAALKGSRGLTDEQMMAAAGLYERQQNALKNSPHYQLPGDQIVHGNHWSVQELHAPVTRETARSLDWFLDNVRYWKFEDPANYYRFFGPTQTLTALQSGVRDYEVEGGPQKVGLLADSLKPLDEFQTRLQKLGEEQDPEKYRQGLDALKGDYQNYLDSLDYDVAKFEAEWRGEAPPPAPDGLKYAGILGLVRKDPVIDGVTYAQSSPPPPPPSFDEFSRQRIQTKLGTLSDRQIVEAYWREAPGGQPALLKLQYGGYTPEDIASYAAHIRSNPAFYSQSPTLTAFIEPEQVAARAEYDAVDWNRPKENYTWDRLGKMAAVPDIVKYFKEDIQNLKSQMNGVIKEVPEDLGGPLSAEELQAYLESRPGYQAEYEIGQQGLQRSLAARGLLGSGQGLLEQQNFGQDMLQKQYQREMNRLADVASIGMPFVAAEQQDSTQRQAAIRAATNAPAMYAADTMLKSGQANLKNSMFNAQNNQQVDTVNTNNRTTIAKLAMNSNSPSSPYSYSPYNPSSEGRLFSGMF